MAPEISVQYDMGMWRGRTAHTAAARKQRQCLRELSPFLFDSIQAHRLWNGATLVQAA